MSTSSTRHDRRRLETTNRILLAAAELFGQRGLQATKISDICASADVAQQTFFNHFPSKAELVRALVSHARSSFFDSIEDARSEEASLAERIGLVFERVQEATVGAGPMHQELVSELFHAAQAERDPEMAERVVAAVQALIEAGVARGEVTARHTSEDLALLVLGALQILMLQWAGSPDFPIAERAARMAGVVADLIAPSAHVEVPAP